MNRLLALGFAIGTCLCPGAMAGEPVFADRADRLPVAHVYDGGWEHFVGGGVAVFDCNGDALPDFVVAGGENPARLFLNETAAPGGDLAFGSGAFPVLTGVTGLYPLDIDNDGHTDLAVLRVGPNLLLRGDGQCGFTPADWGFESGPRWTTAFSATWMGDDTFPTLAFGNYVDRTDPDGPFQACDDNWLYRPTATGFDAGEALVPGFCPLSMLFSDFSRRGAADLRLSNDRHYYVRDGGEQMWRPGFGFLDAAQGWAQVSIWGMGIASRDLDGDLRPDVMLTSMGDQLLQFNTADGFRNAPYETGATAHRPHVGEDGRPSTGWHSAFGDADNDGFADIFIAKGNVDQMPGLATRDPNTLLMGDAAGHFTESAARAGIATMDRSRGAGFVDLNRDGLLDLVVVNRRAPLELWQNVTPSAGNWVGVDVAQQGANRNAIGAWVELRDPAGRIQTQEITIGGGHAGGILVPLHFGLGTAGAAELRVIWPDGQVGPWQAANLNSVNTLNR